MKKIKYCGRTLKSRLSALKVSLETVAFLSGEPVEDLEELRETGGDGSSRLAAILCLLSCAGEQRRDYVTRLAGHDRPSDVTEWRAIPWFPDYEASSTGQVRRVGGSGRAWVGRVLSQKRSKWGHRQVTVASPDGRQVMIGVHRLVCVAFNGEPPPGKPMSCHKNGVADDNRPENLYWGDHADNFADMMEHAAAREKAAPKVAQKPPKPKAVTQPRHKGRRGRYETVMVRGVEKCILVPPEKDLAKTTKKEAVREARPKFREETPVGRV